MRERSYLRSIELYGRGVLHINIREIEEKRGLYFHKLIKRDNRPSFDFAYDFDSKQLYYCSLILMDEPIIVDDFKATFPKDALLIDFPEDLTEKNYHSWEKDSFKVVFNGNSLIIVSKEACLNRIKAESIDKHNYVLFDETIRGILLEDLSEDEIKMVKESELLRRSPE